MKNSRGRSRKQSGSGKRTPKAAGPILITPRVLSRWPLPQPGESGDKEERGSVLVVGGATEMPGAIILAATGALRAGAGKLQIATCRSIAHVVAAAVPEARVFALAETKTGDIAASAAAEIAERAGQVQATLIGPGMISEDAAAQLVLKMLPHVGRTTLVIDAVALMCLAKEPTSLQSLHNRAVITPHAGEMASIRNVDKDAVMSDAAKVACETAAEIGAVVALKGAETFVAAPTGECYCNRTGNVGLATSGSGDTLSGIVAGLLARGAPPLQAAAWSVFLHGRAGDRLAKRIGPLGFLARELLAEVPALMAGFGGKKNR